MSSTEIKQEKDAVPIIVRDWGKLIDLSSECDCQPCTVRRVVWPGIARGLGDDVNIEEGKVQVRPWWCEKRGKLPGVEKLKGEQGVADGREGTSVEDVPSSLRNLAKKEAASVATNPFRRDKRLYEKAIGEEGDAAPRSGVRRVGAGKERAGNAVIKEERLETGPATKEGAPALRNPFRKDKTPYAVATVEDAFPEAAVLRGHEVEEGATSTTASTRQVRKATKVPQHSRKIHTLKTEDDKATVKREIKSECDKETPVGFMNTRATIVTSLSKTNNDLIRGNRAHYLASFLNSKKTKNGIDVRKRTEAAPNEDASEDLNDDGAQNQTRSELTNSSDKMTIPQLGQAVGMDENANDTEFAHALSRELSEYSTRRPGSPQRAKGPIKPQPPNPKAAMASIKAEANKIKKEPTVKTEPQWNITKDALRPSKHLIQNSTPQVTQGNNATQASISGKTSGTQPFATPAIPKDPKMLVLQYTPGKDPLEAPRGPRSRFPGLHAKSVSSSSLSPAPIASPSSSYSVQQLPSYNEAQLKGVRMPCANCNRTGVQKYNRGPTGCTLCDTCHRLWTSDGRPLSWRGLGENMVGQAFSGNSRQTASTPAMPSSELVDYSDEEPSDSDDSDYSFNSNPGDTKSKPSQTPTTAPSKHFLASMKQLSAENIAGSSFKPPSSKKRDHGATGLSDHNRPYKMPRKNDAVLSVFDMESKDETPEPGEVGEIPKEKPVGVATDAKDDKARNRVNSDEKKGLKDTAQTFTMLCRKLFELEKLEKEEQARVQRGEQALEDAKKKKTGNQNEITGLVITMNYIDKTLARQRDSIAKHVGKKHSRYQQLVQRMVGHEAKRQKHQERFLELSRADMEVEGEETPQDRVKRSRTELGDTTRELEEVRKNLKKLTGDEA